MNEAGGYSIGTPASFKDIIGKVPFESGQRSLLGKTPVGRGGFGAVYKLQCFTCEVLEDGYAPCSLFKKPVAVKVSTRECDFRQELAANAGLHRQWGCCKTEYYACGRPSEALAEQLDLPDMDQPVFIQIMPLAKYGSLRDVLSGKSRDAANMRWDTVVNEMSTICHALLSLQRKGWDHRDIKPENILVDDGGWLLADFGLAGPIPCHLGDKAGTPRYQPRIVQQRGVPDPTTDLFAWGVVLAELLCNQHGVAILNGDFRSAVLQVLDRAPRATTPEALPFLLTLAAASIVALTTWELPEEDWEEGWEQPSLRPSIADAVLLMYDYADLVDRWRECWVVDATGARWYDEGLPAAARLVDDLRLHSKLAFSFQGDVLPAPEQPEQKYSFINEVFRRHEDLMGKDLMLVLIQNQLLRTRTAVLAGCGAQGNQALALGPLREESGGSGASACAEVGSGRVAGVAAARELGGTLHGGLSSCRPPEVTGGAMCISAASPLVEKVKQDVKDTTPRIPGAGIGAAAGRASQSLKGTGNHAPRGIKRAAESAEFDHEEFTAHGQSRPVLCKRQKADNGGQPARNKGGGAAALLMEFKTKLEEQQAWLARLMEQHEQDGQDMVTGAGMLEGRLLP